MSPDLPRIFRRLLDWLLLDERKAATAERAYLAMLAAWLVVLLAVQLVR